MSSAEGPKAYVPRAEDVVEFNLEPTPVEKPAAEMETLHFPTSEASVAPSPEQPSTAERVPSASEASELERVRNSLAQHAERAAAARQPEQAPQERAARVAPEQKGAEQMTAKDREAALYALDTGIKDPWKGKDSKYYRSVYPDRAQRIENNLRHEEGWNEERRKRFKINAYGTTAGSLTAAVASFAVGVTTGGIGLVVLAGGAGLAGVVGPRIKKYLDARKEQKHRDEYKKLTGRTIVSDLADPHEHRKASPPLTSV